MCRFVKFGVEGDAYQKTVADQFFEVVTAVVGFELLICIKALRMGQPVVLRG